MLLILFIGTIKEEKKLKSHSVVDEVSLLNIKKRRTRRKKVVPVHAMKTYREKGSVVPLILIFGPRWR